MFNDRLFLNFQGFHVSEFVRANLNHQLQQLLEEAPYGATLNVTVCRRQPHLFTGSMVIQSPAGRFQVKASEHKFTALISRLSERLQHRLDKWKQDRFRISGENEPGHKGADYEHSA